MFDGSALTLTLDRPRPAPLDLAPWHERRPHLVASALAEARILAPHLVDLADRWLPRMPRRPVCSQNVRAICRDPSSGPLLLPDAFTCPWVSVNTPAAQNAIPLDVDHDDAFDLREDLRALGCPIPDLMFDPWSGRAHAVLWLETPVLTSDAARPAPQATADYAARLLAAALRATVMPQAALVKSPWGRLSALTGTRLLRGPRPSVPDTWTAYEEARAAGSDLMWITIPGSGPAELRDVIAALAPRFEFDASPSKRPAMPFRKKRGIPDGRGRNCELFDLVRWWAYDRDERDTTEIHAEADRLNGSGLFATPLPRAEVTALARSIGRFMRNRFRPRHGADASRGRDRAAGAALDIKARQALAGRVSAEGRTTDTDAKITAAITVLAVDGVPSLAAIAAAAGCSRDTVKRHKRAARGGGAYAVLSGSAPAGRSKEPQATTPSESLSSSVCPSSAVSVSEPEPIFDEVLGREVRATIDLMRALVTKMDHQAKPVEPLLIPVKLARIPEVRQAIKDAERAWRRTRLRWNARLSDPLSVEESIFEDGS